MTDVSRLIARLGDGSTDGEKLTALARTTAALRAQGRNWSDVAELTKKWDAPAAPRLSFDWLQVAEATRAYTEGRSTVTRVNVYKAMIRAVPGLKRHVIQDRDIVGDYLRRLGFRQTSYNTFTRV
jgi:hypothetical protein